MPSIFPAQRSTEFDEALEVLDFARARSIINELRAEGHPCVWMQNKLNVEKSVIDGTYQDFSTASEAISSRNEPTYVRE